MSGSYTDDDIANLRAEIAALAAEADRLRAELGTRADEFERLSFDRDVEIGHLEAQLRSLADERRRLRVEAAAGQQLEQRAAAREAEIGRLGAALQSRDDEIVRLTVDLGCRSGEVARASKDIGWLATRVEALYTSRSWKITRPLRWLAHLAKSLRRARSGPASVVSGSGLFDPAYYRSQTPIAHHAVLDAVEHYLERGAVEGLDPHPLFDTSYYLERNRDVAEAGINPLVHYIEHGAAEGRDPHPLFDTSFYLACNPDVVSAGVNPLLHFLARGVVEGGAPHPLFDTSFYRECNPDVAAAGVNPLVHFLRHGAGEGRAPHPLFNVAFYREGDRDAVAAGTNPLLHYLARGVAEGRAPHPLFDASFYLDRNPDVVASGDLALEHYVRAGGAEGRDPHPLFDGSFYLVAHPEVRTSGMTPLEHYLRHGAAAGLDPHPLFSTADYLAATPEFDGRMSPLEHHVRRCAAAGKPPGPFSATARAVRLIAFYLPQFHPTPENDRFWGKGFTEWANVNRARPLFEGHAQPRLPGELGFYDLRKPEVSERQAELARQHGVEGFCYYYYWFDGRILLRRPLERMLESGQPNFPFCICWANESWTRRWDGSEEDVLVQQEYREGYAERFARDVVPILRDPRYIRVDGRPLLVVYRLGQLPDPVETAATWRRVFRECGIGDVLLAAVESFGLGDPRPLGFDVAIEFPPHNPPVQEHRGAAIEVAAGAGGLGGTTKREPVAGLDAQFRGILRDYRDAASSRLAAPAPPYPRFRGLMVAWDNTPRAGLRGMIYHHASPALYQRWLEGVLATARTHAAPYPPMAFVNAWNEWAEGAHLEPDAVHGRAYLEATAAALGRVAVQASAEVSGPAPGGVAVAVEPPEISIIVPVYNQVELTLECLRSLRAHRSASRFEVIVVDDGSDPPIRSHLEGLDGITYLRRETNRGFGATCHLGAIEAHGRYLVFLNNDATVCEDWLDELRSTFETWPETGLAGSKIIHPDGRLQECGGFVFRDGSAAHYGRGGDPDDPGYCYAREADYVSGASMMIPRDLFWRLGGFDRRYEPAYYEDVDLAFKVRVEGLRVVVNPHSRVIHHEGATAGRDICSGIKRYQEINALKFRQKWKATLESYPARPRGDPALPPSSSRVLVIDWIVPRPDRDAGSLRMAEMVRSLRELGCHVTIAARDLWCDDGSHRIHERHGVEVIRKPHFDSLEEYLTRHGSRFDHVVISRRDTAALCMPLVQRWCGNARIIFDTVDLHFVREERMHALQEGTAPPRELGRRRVVELDLVARADVTLVVSPEEKELLDPLAPGKDIRVLSTINDARPLQPGFSERDGLLFIGYFPHAPNVDGVLWFVRAVLPILDRLGFRSPIHLIGSHPPPEIVTLASEQIHVHGFVPDVEPFFARCRLSIAPLRAGAGVKGKVSQSMALGLPCVTTSVGAEGTYMVDGRSGLLADAAEHFARQVQRLHSDERLWVTLRDGGLEIVRENFSIDAAKRVLAGLCSVRRTTASPAEPRAAGMQRGSRDDHTTGWGRR